MKKIISYAILLIVSGILLGAFAAHGLKNIVSSELISSFQKGVQYQLFNGIGILCLINIVHIFKTPIKGINLIFIGTLLFSVSIYLLILSNYLQLDALKSILGPITPLGGILMILGWCKFLFGVLKTKF